MQPNKYFTKKKKSGLRVLPRRNIARDPVSYSKPTVSMLWFSSFEKQGKSLLEEPHITSKEGKSITHNKHLTTPLSSTVSIAPMNHPPKSSSPFLQTYLNSSPNQSILSFFRLLTPFMCILLALSCIFLHFLFHPH